MRWSRRRDPRVVPMLVRILDESEPLGKDHDVVLDTLDALGWSARDAAVPSDRQSRAAGSGGSRCEERGR